MSNPAGDALPNFSPLTPQLAPEPERVPGVVVQRIIRGMTSKNAVFRPADWAERLCGVMSCFRPDGFAGRNAHMTYSMHVKPIVIDGTKCVVVDEALRSTQPLAYHFVINFAKDNDLQILDACLLPEGGSQGKQASHQA